MLDCLMMLTSASVLSATYALDQIIAQKTKQGRCPWCRGALCDGGWERKLALPAGANPPDGFLWRESFCCSRCRRRTTPPSARFPGRVRSFAGLVLVARILAKPKARSEWRAIATLLGITRRTLVAWLLALEKIEAGTRGWLELCEKYACSGLGIAGLWAKLLHELGERAGEVLLEDAKLLWPEFIYVS